MASFRGDKAFLSNFYPAPVPVAPGGPIVPTVEHAYVWNKTFSPQERALVEACNTPGAVKKLGRGLTIRPDWDEVKVGIMTYLVRQKFFLHKDLEERLMATGDEELIEINEWGDTFWGMCNGRGENWLGKILMDVRSMCFFARGAIK